MPPVTEILVHTSGPSSARDDDFFRRMATAYNDNAFQQLPEETQRVTQSYIDDTLRAAQAISSQLLTPSLLIPSPVSDSQGDLLARFPARSWTTRGPNAAVPSPSRQTDSQEEVPATQNKSPTVSLTASPSQPSTFLTTKTTQVLAPHHPPGIFANFSHPPPPTSLAALASAQPILAAVLAGVIFPRPIEPDERGHWLIPQAAMALMLGPAPHERAFDALWTFLKDFVARGDAGWDVSLFLETACSSQEPQTGHASVRGQTGAIRLYSFASAAAHMYLLLFIASKSAVTRAGIEWIDANGDAVGYYTPLSASRR